MASDLPVDAHARQRLQALAALVSTYDELLGRVLADAHKMRSRLRRLRPRPTQARRKDRRKR